MARSDDLDAKEVERIATELVRRLFRRVPSALHMHMTKEEGAEAAAIVWEAGDWRGRLVLQREPPREITSKELAGVLLALQLLEPKKGPDAC